MGLEPAPNINRLVRPSSLSVNKLDDSRAFVEIFLCAGVGINGKCLLLLIFSLSVFYNLGLLYEVIFMLFSRASLGNFKKISVACRKVARYNFF